MTYKGTQRLGDFFSNRREKGAVGLSTLSITLDHGIVDRDSIDRKMETNLLADEHLLGKSGDIAYNMMRMWQGASGLIERDGLLSPAYVVLAPKQEINSRYAAYLFKSPRLIYLFWAYSYGLTNDRLRLYFNDFRRIPVEIPPISEQTKIANFLTTVDEKISQLTQKCDLLKQYKKGVMQQIFSQKLRFKDDDGHEFPEWIEKKMGDTLSIFSGYAFSSNHSQASGVKWLKIADVGIQQMTSDNPSYLPFELRDKHKNFLVFKDDYVIALTRPILNGELKIARVDQNYHGSLLNQRVGKLVSNEVIDFIYFLLQLKNTVSQITDTISGTDPPNLSLNEIKGIKLKIPRDREEQTKIANFLTAIDEKISQLTQKYDLLKQYKKGVMQQIFSQKLRFKDDDGRDFPKWEVKKLGEVFSEVLEKIQDQNLDTYSITAGKGFVSQHEKFGKDISGKQNSNYVCLRPLQFAYNKGSSKTFKYGCIYVNLTGKNIAVPNVFISFGSKLPIATNFYSKLFEQHFLDKSLKKLISSTARMDGLLNVSKNDFFKIEIPYPILEEQAKIANFLTAIDDKITQAQTQLDAVKQYKKGLLQQLFV